MIEPVDAASFEQKVLQAAMPVVVDVWAAWCHPCKMMEPAFKAAAHKFQNQARFLKLEADANQEIVKRYKVLGIPTLLYFSHGRLVNRKTGLQSEQAIAGSLRPLFPMSAEEADSREITGIFSPAARIKLMLGLAMAVTVLGGIRYFNWA